VFNQHITISNPPLLLIGYNRYDLLEKRVKEISKLKIEKVYISIDGGRESQKSEMSSLIAKIPHLFTKNTNVKITQYENNLGLTKHITIAISKVLEENENVIVVEDDVAINSSFYKNITMGLNLLKTMGVSGLVSGFSPISYSGKYFLKNKWRKSIYFACWGWGCDRDTWAKYKSDLSNINFDEALKNSSTWNTLSLWQKSIWKSRFLRVQHNEDYTWDFQMQFASFMYDYTNLAPLYRFVDNEGFNDERATHTKNSKPKWMANTTKCEQFISSIAGNLITKLFSKIDQLTIAGDSKILPVYKSAKKYFNFKKIGVIASILLPKIKIHTWGGLGSQLYAVALAIDLQKNINYRQIEYISHTSGVTRREPALQFYTTDVKEKNDYTRTTSVQEDSKYRKKLSLLGKKLLISLRIVANCNDNEGINRMKPWTLIIRGHYSNRKISFDSATRILQRINNEFYSEKNDKDMEILTLHYRLGDLEKLSEKSPIDPNHLKSILALVLDEEKMREIYLYSDSILLAESKLITGKSEISVVSRDISPLKTIHECVHSKVFIGTNSKISIWVAILRATKNINQISYLPVSIKHMLSAQESSFVTKSIKFY
jgi:hypothetical protein